MRDEGGKSNRATVQFPPFAFILYPYGGRKLGGALRQPAPLPPDGIGVIAKK